jgi:hypothetical protein
VILATGMKLPTPQYGKTCKKNQIIDMCTIDLYVYSQMNSSMIDFSRYLVTWSMNTRKILRFYIP